jgi:CBS-domain-containing membrane protein
LTGTAYALKRLAQAGVRRKVNGAQAAIVREISGLHAAGFGRERMAKHLNAPCRPLPRWRRMTRRIKRHRIREIITRSPVTVSPEIDVRRLKRLFDRHDVNAFPVVDDKGFLRGIVSTLDILRLFRPSVGFLYPDLRALWAQHAEDVMGWAVVTVGPNDFVETAVKLLVQYRHRRLPVVEGRRGRPRVVGIVSRRDTLSSLVLEADSHE